MTLRNDSVRDRNGTSRLVRQPARSPVRYRSGDDIDEADASVSLHAELDVVLFLTPGARSSLTRATCAAASGTVPRRVVPRRLSGRYPGRSEARTLVEEQDARIRYVRTTFLPGDETILHVFEAPSAEA